ncbi:acetolactate synthase large subunit [Pyruvatibacter mobilis]|uniref:acetolactate synthase large subunit n=1 Tax=Pyruvatibacter mobilis TaxID=1712261 RepID=UPI003BB1D843
MNGAESLVQTFVNCGVEVCFTNPGTSEMHFVAALDRIDGIRPVLGLFEGVVTGAADGYGRMAGKPAATLLHLGAGLGNGFANLHNARRAATPIINVVGEHATYHRQYDAPLASDIASVARPNSVWMETPEDARDVAAAGARAYAASMSAPGGIATLILPADTAWLDADAAANPVDFDAPHTVDGTEIDKVAAALKNGKKSAILLRGRVLLEDGLELAGRIQAATGARIMCDTFTPRMQRGVGRVRLERIPYFAEQAQEFLEGTEQLILVGAKNPVAFFAYPGKESWLTPKDADTLILARPEDDGMAALEALAEAVGAPAQAPEHVALAKPDLASGDLDADGVGRAIAHFLPEGAVMSDEGATAGLFTNIYTETAAPHDHMTLTGGSIGQGLPLAAGAAIACPDRKVVCFHGDGGAMYTLQSLWTMAREQLDVVTVILANRSYAILNIELMRVGAENPGPKALSMLDLHNPDLNWVKLAQGMGVEAVACSTAEDFNKAFEAAMSRKGPFLIEAII